MGDSRIKDAASLLAAFFDEEKARRGGRYAAFFGNWKRIAGERLAAHSRVRDIENGILIVEAEHPGWVQLLQLRQAEMLEQARALFPELALRGISFRLGRDAGAVDEEAPAAPRMGPFGPGGRNPSEGPGEGTAPGTGEPGASSLEDIRDPALRSLLGELKKTVEGD